MSLLVNTVYICDNIKDYLLIGSMASILVIIGSFIIVALFSVKHKTLRIWIWTLIGLIMFMTGIILVCRTDLHTGISDNVMMKISTTYDQ